MQLGKKQKYFESFISKVWNKTLKRLLLLNKSVESWELEVVPGQKKVERKIRFTWKMDDMGEEAVVEVELFQHVLRIKIFTYIPG